VRQAINEYYFADTNIKQKEIREISANIQFLNKEYYACIKELEYYIEDLTNEEVMMLLRAIYYQNIKDKQIEKLIEILNYREYNRVFCLEVIDFSILSGYLNQSKTFMKLLIEKEGENILILQNIIEKMLTIPNFAQIAESYFRRYKELRLNEDSSDTSYSYLEAMLEFRKKNYQVAKELFSKLFEKEKFKTNIEFLYNFGQIYFDTKNYQKSIKFYKYILKLKNKDINSLINIGHIYLINKKIDRAHYNLNEAYLIDEDRESNFALNYYLGRVYLKLKQFNKSLELFNQCIKISPRSI